MKPLHQFMLTLAASALATGTTQAALTAYWNLDGNATDQVSSTAGTLNGAAATNGSALAPGSTSSLSLPSSGSYLESNSNGGLGGTGSFTVLAWFNTTTTANGALFNYSPSGGAIGGADLRLLIQGNGDLRVEMSQGAGFDLSAAGDLGDGTTHMIAAVFNSSTGDSFQDIDLYVDGTFYDVTGGTDHAINLGASEVFIGRDQVSATNRPFIGLIDDVAIYDEALSLAELDGIAANGVLPALNLFSVWMSNPAFGLMPENRGFSVDPDKDGLSNGVEAWLGTHPGQFNGGLGGLASNFTTTTFSHPQSAAPPSDLSASYEWSTNLSDWYLGDGVDGPVGGASVTFDSVVDSGTANVTATSSQPLEPFFLRLKVSQN